MDSILVIIAISLTIASVINIILTKFSISHIIGYIITGTVVSTLFDFNGSKNLHSLDLIGEFAATRRQHHDRHDAFGIDHAAIAANHDFAFIRPGSIDEFRRRAGMDA